MSDEGPAIRDLLAKQGRVQLEPRPYTISSPDDANHALTLASTATELVGGGCDRTILNILADGLEWGVALTKAQCRLSDLTVNFVGRTAPPWLIGMPGAPGTSAERCRFSGVHGVIAAGATIPAPSGSVVGAGIFAIGPDHPGVSNFDPANARLTECFALNQAGIAQRCSAYLLGNGTSGNVVQITLDDCTVATCTYGVQLAGCGVRWNAGGMSGNAEADIYVEHGNADPIVFTGLRGEDGGRAIWGGNCGPVVSGVQLIGCNFTDYATDQIVKWNAQGTLSLHGGHLSTKSGNTTFGLNTDGGSQIPGLVTVGLHTDARNPYPKANPARYIRTVIAPTYGERPVPGANLLDLPMVA